MTEEEKKSLTNKLSAKKDSLFDTRYSEDNRKWFARKTIDRLLAQGTADAQVETKTKEYITKATAALKTRKKKGFSTGNLASKWADFNEIRSRIQIIYGAIALHPEFLDTAHQAYFDFIVERRYRAIKRMVYYVNPNDTRNVFAYPDTGCLEMKVNKNSQTAWTGFESGTIPFVLSTAGKANSVKTVEDIFKKNTGCDRNIFACDPVATILHMDALQEAKDKKKLLDKLVTEGDHYLKIDHPFAHWGNYPEGGLLFALLSAPAGPGTNVEAQVGNVGMFLSIYKGTGLNENTISDNRYFALSEDFLVYRGNDSEIIRVTGVNPGAKKIRVQQLTRTFPAGAKIYWHKHPYPAYHFLTDTRPDKALFEQTPISINDLQVGDHVYVRNHPLYGIYYPKGAWGGEHSFIMEIGDRDLSGSTFDATLLVAGHGLRSNILDMGTDMLNWINNVLSLMAAIIKIHVNYLKVNGYTSTAKVKVIPKQEGGFHYKYFEYDMPYKIHDYRAGVDIQITHGFVLKEEDTEPQKVQLYNHLSKDSTLPSPATAVIKFIGNNFSSTTRYILGNWGVQSLNTEKMNIETTYLYEKDNKTEKILDFNDLKNAAPFARLHNTGDLFVIRPRVDFSQAYQTYLKNNGAI